MNLDRRNVIHLIRQLHLRRLPLGYHLVFQRPPRPSRQLRNHDVAVAEEVDVEIDVVDRIARDVDLRYVAGEKVWDFGYGGDFHGRAHDDDEVDFVFIHVLEAVEEIVGQGFAEEGDVRFHDAGLGDVEGAVGL